MNLGMINKKSVEKHLNYLDIWKETQLHDSRIKGKKIKFSNKCKISPM